MSEKADRKEIVDMIAQTLFTTAWADKQDRLAEEGKKHKNPGPGGDWMDISPKPNAEAKRAAKKLAAEIEKIYGMDLSAIYTIAASEPGRHTRQATLRDFGFTIAMEALGHGVSWQDDHPSFRVNGKVFDPPHIEFYLDY